MYIITQLPGRGGSESDWNLVQETDPKITILPPVPEQEDGQYLKATSPNS